MNHDPIEFDPVDAIGAGAFGEPGARTFVIQARKGAVIRFWEGGGGGWRDPVTRPPEWVLEDVIDGFVSIEAARDVYRVAVVVVDEDAALYEVDEVKTAQLRGADSGSDSG